MSTKRIPPESWPQFFESFTRQHHGWLVWLDNGIEGPLQSIRPTAAGIEIVAGDSNYRIAKPANVSVTTSPDDETAVEHLDIESGSEHVTLRFRAVINPELVDGVMP